MRGPPPDVVADRSPVLTGNEVPGLKLSARLAALGLAVFLLALAPRLLARDLFPTSDEDSWMRRTGGFTFGLVTGQLGRTYQNGHPGVSTMWIGLLSQGPGGALRFADQVHGLRFVGQVPGYMEGLAQARIGFAVLGALAAAGTSLLVAQLFGFRPAVLTGLGLTAEPFLVANQQLVHVDGALTAFLLLTCLLALARWTADAGRWHVALCGVTTGLALLSKSPAIYLVAYVPLVALLGRHRGATTAASALTLTGSMSAAARRGDPIWHDLRRAAFDAALWGILALATIVLLWPALWVLGPIEIMSRLIAFTRETGGQPDEVGSYFLGEIGSDPGPYFYPVATLFRLSPFTTFGLAVLAIVGWKMTAELRARVLWLFVFIGGFSLMMTFGPKKFDRYLLPIFPLLIVLASIGWSALFTRLHSPAVQAGLGMVLVALLVWPLASTYPYPLSFYSPLFGGGAAAQRSVMIGNGEGLDQAAHWLADQPNAADLRVAAHSFDILTALIPGDGEPLRDGVPADADYIVTYGRRIQMHRWSQSMERYFAANPPVYTVWINGIEYARIHPGPHRRQVS